MNTSEMLTGLNSEITAWLIPLKLDGKSAKPCLLCLIVLAYNLMVSDFIYFLVQSLQIWDR